MKIKATNTIDIIEAFIETCFANGNKSNGVDVRKVVISENFDGALRGSEKKTL